MRVGHKVGHGAPSGEVDAARSLAAAPNQDQRHIVFAAQLGAVNGLRQLAAGLTAVLGRGDQFPAHRIAGDDGLAAGGYAAKVAGSVGKADGDALGEQAHGPDGPAGRHVGQVDEHRDAAQTAGRHDRGAHVAAGDQADIRLKVAQNVQALAHPARHLAHTGEGGQRAGAAHLAGVNAMIGDAGAAHQHLLHAADAADPQQLSGGDGNARDAGTGGAGRVRCGVRPRQMWRHG